LKKVERQSTSTYFAWDIIISREHYAMHAAQLFIDQSVYPMIMSSVPQAWCTFDRKSIFF